VERNPYSPPASVVADAHDEGHARERKRPAAVWIISVWYSLAVLAGLSAIAFRLIAPRNSPELLLPLVRQGTPLFVWLCAQTMMQAVAMVQLFRVKRSAAYFVSLTCAAEAYNSVMHIVGHEDLEVPMVTLLIEVAMLVYVWRLFRKGVLK
jgi:hypothetical protein